jgi:hypothetical protein
VSGTPTEHRWALGLLLLVLTFGVFAFGAMELWAREWLRFGAIGCLALVLWSSPRWSVFPRPARSMALVGIGILLVAVIQVVPLPGPLLEAVSPSTAALYERTVPPDGPGSLPTWLIERADENGVRSDLSAPVPELPETGRPAGAGSTLSVYPHATVRVALNWLTPLILFVVASAIASDRFLRYRLLWGISILAALLALVGLAQRISWNGLLLWFRERPPASRPLGPFVSPTHFAGFVELGALVAIGLVLALVGLHGRRLDFASIRDAMLDRDWTLPRLLMAGACALLAITGLLLTESRGGYLAFACGLVFLLLARRARAVVVVLVAIVAVVGAAAGVLAWVGGDASNEESVPFVLSSTDPSGSLRLNTWGNSLRIVADYPAAGTGLGTFRWIYPAYQRSGEWNEWRQAHNDFIQLLAETGAMGGILLVVALYLLVRRFLVPALDPRSTERPWSTAAVAAAVFAMLVHSIVDFNLQVPSNAALFAVLLGVLAAAAEDGSAHAESREGAAS